MDGMGKVGDRIRAAREAKGWSQERLGANVGVSQQSIAKIEQDTIVRTRHLARIAQVLEIPLHELDEALAVGLTILSSDTTIPIYLMTSGTNNEFLLSKEPNYHARTPEPLMDVVNAFGILLPQAKWADGFRAGDVLLCGKDEKRGDDRMSIYFGAQIDGHIRTRFAGISIEMGDGNLVLQRMTVPGADIVPVADWATRFRVFGVWYVG